MSWKFVLEFCSEVFRCVARGGKKPDTCFVFIVVERIKKSHQKGRGPIFNEFLTILVALLVGMLCSRHAKHGYENRFLLSVIHSGLSGRNSYGAIV